MAKLKRKKMKRRCGTFKRDCIETAFLWQDDPDEEAEHFFDVEDPKSPPIRRTPVQRTLNGPINVRKDTPAMEKKATKPCNVGQPTPCERVFGIFTLAERILLQLHPTDILCGAQQTCRLWHQTVNQSSFIQELLFFKPIPAKFAYYFESGVPEGRWTHRLWFGRIMFFENFGTEVFKSMPVVENPFLSYLRDPRRRSEGRCSPSAVQPSWRRMLATQPPVTELWACSSLQWTSLRCINGTGRQVIQDFIKDPHVRPPPAAITLADLSCLKPLYGITQGSLLRHFEGWEQIKALKTESRLDEQFLELLLAEEESD